MSEVARSLCLSRTTVYKWWDATMDEDFIWDPDEDIEETMQIIRDSEVTEEFLKILKDLPELK